MSNVGIYKITSPSNKVYIGQSLNIGNRFRNYRSLSKAIKKQPKFYSSLLKYGWSSHKAQIIHELPIDVSKNVIDEYEKLYIEQYKYCGVNLMNIREGGANGRHSPETIKKMKSVTSNRSWYVKGSVSNMRGKNHTEATKSKMSLAKKGKPSSFKDKKHSAGSLEKMSKSQKGKKMPPRSEEYRRNISLAHIGKKCPLLSRKLICTETGKIYGSIGEAAQAFGIHYNTLMRYLRGVRKNKTTLKYYTNGS